MKNKDIKYNLLKDGTSIFLPPDTNTTTELTIGSGSSPFIGLNFRANPQKNSWSKWLIFGHILTLYVTVFILYAEVQFVRQSMTEYNLNSINVTLRNMRVEINCIREIEEMKKIIKEHISNGNNLSHREKREALVNKVSSEGLSEFNTAISAEVRAVPRSSDNHNRSNDGNKERRRGKKNKRKNSRRRCHAGPLVATFKGAIPEPTMRDGGILHPWYKDKESAGEFTLNTKFPSAGKEMIEIVENGLYFIHAQVYYLSGSGGPQQKQHSYTIMLLDGQGGNVPEVPLAHCASVGPAGGQATCYTAVVRHLSPGDRLFIRQLERDVHVTMRPGQTFFTLLLLSKTSSR